MPILIHTRRYLRWLLFAILLGCGLRAVSGETLSAPEYKIKAAFLYNFAVLTEWKTNAFDSPKEALTIAVLGKDPFGWILEETMKGKTVGGRKINIQRYKQVKDIDKCHLLFISSSEEAHLEEIFAALAKRPILTVSEIDRFNYRGGMIWVRKQKNEIKFRIRYGVARDAGLKLSSKLLVLSINAVPKKKKEVK